VPFTLSHPAAVLPLAGRRLGRWSLALPPLVAASMAPDVPYYTPLPGRTRAWTHSFTGTFTVDVLLAVVLLGLGVFVARPLADLLPSRWNALVGGWTSHAWPESRTPGAVLAWYLTLVLGALTHVCWDAFTHPDGQVVTRVRALSDMVAGRHLYSLLQLASTIVGGAIVLVALRAAYRATSTDGRAERPFDRRRMVRLAVTTLAVGVVGALVKGAAGAWWGHGQRGSFTLFDLVTGFGAGCTLALFAYAALKRLAYRV
jgi:uncharacterized membrane protein YeaQ/YmgE (transglycosylase-associated protein family)